jgi:probable DNA metabolism protein
MTETIMDYLYDGSFEGFLCCVYLHYYEEKASGIYVQTRYQNKLFQPYKIVDTNYERAERVYEAIESKISSRALKRVYYLLLSNYEEKENIALNYLRLGFRLGAKVDSYHSPSSGRPGTLFRPQSQFERGRKGAVVCQD